MCSSIFGGEVETIPVCLSRIRGRHVNSAGIPERIMSEQRILALRGLTHLRPERDATHQITQRFIHKQQSGTAGAGNRI